MVMMMVMMMPILLAFSPQDQGHLDEALHLLQQATTLRPDFAAAWMNLGIVQASLGDHGSAETSYLAALSHRSVSCSLLIRKNQKENFCVCGEYLVPCNW